MQKDKARSTSGRLLVCASNSTTGEAPQIIGRPQRAHPGGRKGGGHLQGVVGGVDDVALRHHGGEELEVVLQQVVERRQLRCGGGRPRAAVHAHLPFRQPPLERLLDLRQPGGGRAGVGAG